MPFNKLQSLQIAYAASGAQYCDLIVMYKNIEVKETQD